MANNNIKLDSDFIKGKCTDIQGECSNIANKISALQVKVFDLFGKWQGEDFENFYEKFSDFTDESVKLENVTLEMSNVVNAYVEALARIDSAYSGDKTKLQVK